MTDRGPTAIYTRGGDAGSTSLGSGARVSKSSLRVECYGTLDELISVSGVALAFCGPELDELRGALRRIQAGLMVVAARVASADPDARAQLPGLGDDAVARLEAEIDTMTAPLAELRSFILPGGAPASSLLHQCRTVCRRAERRLVELSGPGDVPAEALRYVNRLSDWYFTAARFANHVLGQQEVLWLPR